MVENSLTVKPLHKCLMTYNIPVITIMVDLREKCYENCANKRRKEIKMGWDYSANGAYKQKKYGNFLVRQMGKEFWVINLHQFAGMIMFCKSSLKEAIKYAKGCNVGKMP